MFLYFYLLERAFFRETLKPALAKALRRRNFEPCRPLCREILARSPTTPAEALVRAILEGLVFDRVFWHGLVGECLVYGARDLPRLQTTPETLCCLLAPERYQEGDIPRHRYAPIQQAHLGTRDLVFGGGYYRPDHAGWNDRPDLERLLAYFRTIDPASWTAADLAPMPEWPNDEERAEELAHARDWWPSLVEMYQNALEKDWIVVCERV